MGSAYNEEGYCDECYGRTDDIPKKLLLKKFIKNLRLMHEFSKRQKFLETMRTCQVGAGLIIDMAINDFQVINKETYMKLGEWIAGWSKEFDNGKCLSMLRED